MSRYAARTKSSARSRILRRAARGTATSATLLVFFMAIAYFAAPARLPLLVHHLVALVNATLAMLVVVFAAAEFARQPSWISRTGWRFGWGDLLGVLMFALVLAWWLSPWAPIAVGRL